MAALQNTEQRPNLNYNIAYLKKKKKIFSFLFLFVCLGFFVLLQ